MAEVQEIVSVTGNVASGAGGQRADFGGGLFITEDPTLAATGSGKARGFSDLTSLGRVFPSDSEPYKAALAFFGREDGYPLGLFTVGRWVRNDIGSELQGTTVRSLTNRPNKVTVGFSTGSGATAGRPSVTSGGITSVPIGYRITVTDAGSGYSVAPAVTITGPTGASATATLNASGGVESIAVTDYGHGYSSAPTISVAAPGGGGTRATATAALAPGSGLLASSFCDRKVYRRGAGCSG